MEKFKNQYKVDKTLRFELKAIHFRGENHADDIDFKKTKSWLDLKYFNETSKTNDKKERNKKIRTNLANLFTQFDAEKNAFDYLLEQLEQRNIPPIGVFVKASLLENLDSNLFHEQKKKNQFNQTKFIPLSHLKIRNSYDWFISGIYEKLNFIKRYELVIKSHQLWEQSDFEEMQNNARWYADIESFCNRYLEFLEFLEKKYIEILKINEIEKHEKLDNFQKNIYKKVHNSLKNSFWVSKIKGKKELLKNIVEEIKENKFIECGITSLNEKALNKNPKKREQAGKWLQNLLDKDQPQILSQIHQSDNERKIVLDGENGKDGLYKLLNKESKKWVNNKIDKCPEFAIHLLQTPKYNQDIQNLITKKKELQEIDFEKRTDEEKEELLNTKSEIYQLKIEKGIIQDRKRLFLDKGILSFNFKLRNNLSIEKFIEKIIENPKKAGEFLNFQNIWESKKEQNICKLWNLQVSDELEKLHKQNNKLIKEKRTLSQKYGNNKSLINSLQREIERQNKIEYQSVILRDKDFYYLAFLERENRNELKNKYFVYSENSDYEFLEYERLTFKALEKLALIENATFKEFDELEDEKLAQDLRKVYQSVYKEKQFNEYKLTREENQYIWQNKINKFDFAQEKQEEIKNDVIKVLTKVIKKLGYNFTPKEGYKTLDEFASDINLQCYKINWQKIDWEKIIAGEKSGDIKLFKIHNKDFSRIKRKYQRSEDKTKHRKNNLFTEYWLDLFEKENKNIRLLPEIDLFKRRKEFDKKEFVKTKKRSGEKILKNAIKNNRFFENKLYASFHLQFFPEKHSPTIEEFNKKLEEETQNSKKYFLGLDRGENELLTYCLIDENLKVVIDKETQKPIIGDWNLDDNNFNYAEKLKKFHKEREELLNQSRLLQNSDDKEEKAKIQNRLDEINLLESESIKNGFCGHVLEQINNIMMKYKNVYIIMEDLDIEQNKEDNGNTNKEKILEKFLGATAYQVVEDAIISKFKYYQTKNYQFNGSQLVPNIKRIRDLREVENSEKIERNKYGRIKFYKSKEQIGNLLFLDDFLTSQTCPECGFCICVEKQKERANKFGNPILKSEIKGEINFKKNCIVNEQGEKLFALKHLKYLNDKDTWKKNKKITAKDLFENNVKLNSDRKEILRPRLKACNHNFYKKEIFEDKDGNKKDPFFCANCGKNTEEKNFVEPLESGDDIASYNIAKRGLEFVLREKRGK